MPNQSCLIHIACVNAKVVTLLAFHPRTSDRMVLASAFQIPGVTGTSHGIGTHARIHKHLLMRCRFWHAYLIYSTNTANSPMVSLSGETGERDDDSHEESPVVKCGMDDNSR